ncbi:MAG: hypothetical protein ACI837_002678, partial [Crocinitomicaceae bacterium]
MKKFLLFGLIFLITGATSAQIYSANNAAGFAPWTTTDLDSDGFNWQAADISAVTSPMAVFGECIASFSYDFAASSPLTPDNLLASPAINCSAFSNINLSWAVGSNADTGTGWHQEHYAVYVVTDLTAVQSGTFPTPVFETTLTAGWTVINESINIDAQAAAQPNVYVVMRHFNCTDEYYLLLDDILITGSSKLTNMIVYQFEYNSPSH